MCMDEIWEKAVETALDGVTDSSSARTLTLDGAVKCLHGRLPPPNLLEKFSNLQHLSIANISLSSLEQFPRLRNLEKLILSDNRIAGGLEFLVLAGLDSLRDLDLSNNRIQFIEDLAPLAELKLVSLDLYECPVTRVKDYRVRVFGLIKSLKYLDKMDLEDNERPESDDDDDDDVSEDDEEEDPGSGEIDGEDRQFRLSNGHSSGGEGIVDVDEDEESDADEEETEDRDPMRVTQSNGGNGFRVSVWGSGSVGEEDEDNDEEDESVEEIDEDDGEDEDVVEVHDVGDSDDEDDDDDGEEFEEDDEDDDEDDEVDNVNNDNDDGDVAEPESTGRLTCLDGEIDGHEQGEEDDEDDNGETGGEELGNDDEVYSDEDNDDGDDEEEDGEEGYLVQRVGGSAGDVEDSDMEPGNNDGEEVEDDDDDLGEGQVMAPSSSSQPKRKRDDDDADVDDDDDEDHANGGRPSSKKDL